MNLTKCINGHYIDADKYKFCPHCGVVVNEVNKSIAKKLSDRPKHTDMLMGAIKPPEPMFLGNLVRNDEFISEDPICEPKIKGCTHNFVLKEIYTGGSEFVCTKCGAIKIISTSSPDLCEIIIEPNQFDPAQYVMLPQDATVPLYSDTLKFTIKSSGETKVFNKQEVNVGRDPSNDHNIANIFVARRQATFLYEHQIWFLRDNNSTNGTYINGKRLESGKKYQLATNDEISFSKQEIIIFDKREWNMLK